MTFSLDRFQIFDKEHHPPKNKEKNLCLEILNFKHTKSLISVFKRRVESFVINALH